MSIDPDPIRLAGAIAFALFMVFVVFPKIGAI